MRTNRFNLIWGIALIVAGALFLAQNLGYLNGLAPQYWVGFFAVLSVLFFASYFASGVRAWGWLFPAMGSGAIALTIGLSTAGVHESYVGAPILGAMAVPFLVAYSLDTRRNWWALIPAWVMIVLTVVTAIAEIVPGEVIGALFLFAVALPFWVVFFTNRKDNWWAIIPGGIMTVLGFIPLLTRYIKGDLIGAVIMFLFAVPFLVVFAWSWRNNWWAIIPCGVFATIGGIVLVATSGGVYANNAGVITGVLFGGMALTFLVLWFMHTILPTAWAIYPGGILAILSAIGFGFGANGIQVVWPVIIIGVGSMLLYTALRRRTA